MCVERKDRTHQALFESQKKQYKKSHRQAEKQER
jgi:hypothetical protein